MLIGYHASHEQFPPEELIGHVQAAQRVGFQRAMCSDHISPFLPEQGQSGHAWSWLGAAMQATRLPFCTVTAPGYRYHPAVVAQAVATLCRMFPGRFQVALGSGEYLNEHVAGGVWPEKDERNARLRECHEVMRALWRGERVDHHGGVTVDRARLWSPPPEPPRVLGAAMSAKTAAWMAPWTDGLITVSRPDAELQRLLDAYRDAGGRGKRIHLQAQVSWHPDRKEAARIAHEQWRFAALPPDQMERLATPDEVSQACRDVRPEDLAGPLDVLDDVSDLEDRLQAWEQMGVDVVYLHQVGPDQRGFIEAIGRTFLTEARHAR